MPPKQKIEAVARQARNAVAGSRSISETVLVRASACFGLACMFGGIWLGDSIAAGAVGSPHAMLVMRVFSLAFYIAFFVIAWHATNSGAIPLRVLFGRAATLGIALYVAGFWLILFEAPQLEGAERAAVLWMALLLTKAIGAPASVGLVCVFAQMRHGDALRMAALGMLGAFLAYSLAHQGVSVASVSGLHSAAIALSLILIACLCGMLSLDDRIFGDARCSAERILSTDVVRRPAEQVITPGLVLMLIVSAMMLGYLRSGYLHIDAHTQPYSIAVLALLIAVALLWRRLRVEHVFYIALTCASASILLLPFLSMAASELCVLLCSVGTALFEVVLWVFEVWATRNCVDTLRTAAGMRLVVVAGHFLGTLAVALVLWMDYPPQDASSASGMLIIFAYIMFLLAVVKNPSLHPPFMVHEEESVYAAEAPSSKAQPNVQAKVQVSGDEPSSNAEALLAGEGGSASQVDEYERRYWSDPCDTVAQTYQLTRRETEVLVLLAHGYSIVSMADSLHVSKNTMKMHMRNIYAKLDVHSRQDVISMVDLVRSQQL